jgi:hypothetical protein
MQVNAGEGGGMSNDQKHLGWIYDRLIYVHNESPNVDYMLRFRGIIDGSGAATIPAVPPAPEGVPVAVSEWEDGFMGGVCVALATAKAHGDNVIWREIVRSVGVDNALNYAANVNPADWDLAGFSEYAQLELGKDKPLPLPQVGEAEA